MKIKMMFLAALCFAAVPGGCKKQALPAQSEFVLGTVCTINLYQYGSSQIYGALFSRLRELEGYFSANRIDSDLSAVNNNAGIGPVKVHPELIQVLDRALYYAETSGGAFDPAIGPLVRLWGIGTDAPGVPGDDEIAAALSRINRRDIRIDREGEWVFLTKPGMALDLGAIAKGYAADEAARIIAAAGIPLGIIDLGGNIFAYGEKEGGGAWRIGIQDPLAGRGSYLGFMDVRNKTVVTSGVYERFFETGGKRYHHILSTDTGRPAGTGLLSVTIIADHSIDADALSTAAFVLGYEAGAALAEAENAGAVFVFEDKSVRTAGDAAAAFTLSNGAYRLD